jgi:preprotein translocase subunit YajC
MSSPPLLMTMIQAAPAAGQPSGTTELLMNALPWVAIFVIFYLLMIRPQQRRVKEHQTAITAVKKGDEVVTGGGHIGKVTKVGEDEVEVEFAGGQRHRVVKSMLSEVRRTGSAKPAND